MCPHRLQISIASEAEALEAEAAALKEEMAEARAGMEPASTISAIRPQRTIIVDNLSAIITDAIQGKRWVPNT